MAQVSRPHVVINAQYATRKAFLAVGLEERTGLLVRYHGRVGSIPIRCEHRVGCVVHAFTSFLAMSAYTVCKVDG